ncbi:MAG: hypothetical protein JWM51_380, partial [Microbacteriaceae bacterium]|nr:hypothetical protein [Microbacteriaceae bacterium]
MTSTDATSTDATSTGATSTDATNTEGTTTDATTRGVYGGLWRMVARELGYLLLTLPIAIAALATTSALFSAGLGMIAIIVGFFVILLALIVARGFGTLELVRLEAAGRPPIRRPNWPGREGLGLWRSMIAVVASGHYWLYLLFSMVVSIVLSTLTWSITIFWVSMVLGGLTYWFWQI